MRKLEERFWEKVKKSKGCWIWTGSCNMKGYGHIGEGGIGGRTLAAHRVAYELTYGSIPTGRFVLHHCDNPSCVNPKHLFLGTQRDNVIDMTKKGHKRYKAHIGEDNGRAKLTWNKVRNIRKRYKAGENRMNLANEYGVHWSTINRIVKNKRWKE